MSSSPFDDVVFAGLLVGGTTPGVALTQLACLTVRLGLVDAVAEAPRTARELAESTGCHEPSLSRVLRALVGCGVLVKEGESYSVGPHGNKLRSGTVDSLRAPLVGVSDAWKVWGALEYTVRSGKPAFEHALGAREWEFLRTNPASNQAFTEHMARLSAHKTEVLSSYGFPSGARIVDVGGRDGTLIASLLDRDPTLTGTLFDRREMADIAAQNLKARGLAERCDVVGGDFFEAVPAGGRVYILSSVLHDWERDDCVTILENCRRAMAADARLLVVEIVLEDEDTWSSGTMLDLNMMVITGGRERTRAEWTDLFARAGLRLASTLEVGGYSVLECVPK